MPEVLLEQKQAVMTLLPVLTRLLASSVFGSSEGNVEEQTCISDCCLITERPESYSLDQLSKACLT